MSTELITPAVNFSSGTEGSVPYIKIEGAKDFDLCAVMECGQCFRFTRVEDSAHECEYSGVALGRFIAVAEDGDTLYFYNTDAAEFDAIWRGYFGLDTDYAAIKRDILSRSDREVLREAVEVGGGIRILRQDRWETLCSFIISQNNNIPRIKGIIGRLCEAFGDRIDGGYAFPSADRIASLTEEQLAPIRSGFRARYILDAARRVTDGSTDLDAVSAMSYDDAKKYLMQIKGVGNKVADCVLLFGYGFFDAFPKDVWIKRVIEKYYGENFDESIFKPYGGIAQQYLFYSERGF